MTTAIFMPTVTVTLPNTAKIRRALNKYRATPKASYKAEKRANLRQMMNRNHRVREAVRNDDYTTAYTIIAPVLDAQGFHLYFAAEELTGIDVQSYYLETPDGFFADATGNALLHLLEQAAFGKEVSKEVAPGIVVTETIIDESSESFKAHRAALYKNAVCELLGTK